MNHVDYQYQEVLKRLLNDGVYREGRNGGTYGLFGTQLRFNLRDGFPLLTTKRLFIRGIILELIWFISGSTNAKYLEDRDVNIWREWGNQETRELGPVYGAQWRHAMGIDYETGISIFTDQLKEVIEGIKKDPYGRRHIVDSWDSNNIHHMALPPCHCLFQFHVANGKLSCQLYQRSADWFLGVPFNIASYALLTHLVARECGLEVGDFIHTFGDYHLYANHQPQALEQISRLPYKQLPVLEINKDAGNIFELEPEDIKIFGYEAWNNIKAEVSK